MKTTIEIMREYLERNTNADDSGRAGKAFEIAIRSYIMGREQVKVKAQGKVDIRLTFEGARRTCEIKTACGEIETVASAQMVIYAPVVDTEFPAESQAYVFTREQWLDFVNGYTGRGQFLRRDSRGHEHIQSFYVSETIRPKASKPIANYIWNTCYNLPTVDEVWER